MQANAGEVAAEDYRQGANRWLARAVLAAAVGALVFEQSPANEALRTAVGLEVLSRTSSEWLVGAATLALTFLIEGVSSLLIVAGLQLPASSVVRLTRRFTSEDQDLHNRGDSGPLRSWVVDAALALGVGAGLVVVRHSLSGSAPTRSTRVRIALAASLVVSVVSGLIGVLAAGGIRHAEKVGLGGPARWFVDYATDWRFWLVVFLAFQLGSFVARRIRTRRTSQGAVDEVLSEMRTAEP